MKKCKDCGKEKELKDFHKNGKYYRCRCRKCHNLKFRPATGSTVGQFRKGNTPWNKGLRNTGFRPTNGFTKGHKRNTGKIRTEDHARKISESRFKNAICRHCDKHRQWKKAVWKRDEYECKFCGSSESLCAHHIRSWDDFPEFRFELKNGITMCNSCHSRLHHAGKTFTKEHRKKLSDAHKGGAAPVGAFKKGNVPWNKGLKKGDS